ncbi:MAG: FecR domain-containing protein [Opitutaceae bacterium]|nr:FecR domain-containing protein [Opitutaceae bacterium]
MNRIPPAASDPADDAPARSALDWPREAGLGRELAHEIRAEVARRRRVRLKIIATGTCAALALVLFWSRGGLGVPVTSAAVAVASSKVSAPERRTLPDGSVVELKNGAAFEVDFTPALRRVTLTRGEAHFEVAKNPARPFVVMADGVEVRAVGTAFAVERGVGAVEVVVTEGRVTVARESAAPLAAPTALTAGHRAIVGAVPSSAPDVVALTAAELDRRLAWRVPLLEFSDAPLAEVVRLFVEHGRVRLAIGDPALRNVRVSGILRADNTDALLQLLAADHAIEIESRAGEIILRRR